MQPTQMIDTIAWIQAQVKGTPTEIYLSHKWREMYMGNRPVERVDQNKSILNAITNFTTLRLTFQAHPFAVEVLTAFRLGIILDPDFPIALGSHAFGGSSRGESDDRDNLLQFLYPLNRAWDEMTKALDPLKLLLSPGHENATPKSEEILTIELKYADDVYPQPHIISNVLTNAEKLYSALAGFPDRDEYPPLRIMYISSGSAFRFDLKGLGEPIKQIKLILIEAWSKIRHRKIDDLRGANKLSIESLAVMKQIDKSVDEKVLTSEQGGIMKERIFQGIMGLFDSGALIKEIPDIESISNKELARARHIKLLPSPITNDDSEETPRKPRSVVAGKRTQTKKSVRSKTASKTSQKNGG